MRSLIIKQGHLNSLIMAVYRDKKAGLRRGEVKTHLIDCDACLAWLGHEVEPPILRRAKGATLCCCLEMYMAIEESAPETQVVGGLSEPVQFSLWRGEDPIWTIGARRTNIYYCPWCGARLPSEPFPRIDEANS